MEDVKKKEQRERESQTHAMRMRHTEEKRSTK